MIQSTTMQSTSGRYEAMEESIAARFGKPIDHLAFAPTTESGSGFGAAQWVSEGLDVSLSCRPDGCSAFFSIEPVRPKTP